MYVNQVADFGGDRRETGIVFVRVRDLAGVLPNAILLIDERHQQVRRKFGKAAEIELDVNQLAGLTTQLQVGAKEGQGAAAGSSPGSSGR